MTEWVLEGEKVEQWSELVTVQSFDLLAGFPPLPEALRQLEKRMRDRCADAVWNVIDRTTDRALYEWRITSCKGEELQIEIALLVTGLHGTHRIAYAAKGSGRDSTARAEWIARLRAAELIDGGRRDRDIAESVRDWWPTASSAGATLTLMEIQRKKERGLPSVGYAVAASGVPPGKVYALWAKPSFDRPVLFFTGVEFNEGGEMVCKGEDCPDPKRMSLHAVAHAPAEPYRVALIALDGSAYAFGLAFPNPIEARDGSCHVWLELAAPDASEFTAFGEGFAPNGIVKAVNRSDKRVATRELPVSAEGTFQIRLEPTVDGKKNGKAHLTVESAGCRAELEYLWGPKALKR